MNTHLYTTNAVSACSYYSPWVNPLHEFQALPAILKHGITAIKGILNYRAKVKIYFAKYAYPNSPIVLYRNCFSSSALPCSKLQSKLQCWGDNRGVLPGSIHFLDVWQKSVSEVIDWEGDKISPQYHPRRTPCRMCVLDSRWPWLGIAGHYRPWIISFCATAHEIRQVRFFRLTLQPGPYSCTMLQLVISHLDCKYTHRFKHGFVITLMSRTVISGSL